MEFVYLNDAVRVGTSGISYQEVAPLFHARRPPPDYFFGPVPAQFGRWYFNDSGSPAVGLYTIDDVCLTGNRLLCRGESVFCLPQNGLHPAALEPELARNRNGARYLDRVIDEVMVVLAGSAHTIFGHWIVDFMPRLHVLTECGLDIAKCRYLLPSNLTGFAREWLGLLGIPDSQLTVYDVENERCIISQALIPSNLRGNGRANPLIFKAASHFRERIIGASASVGEANGRRIYVSRRNWGNPLRRVTNVEAVEGLAVERGFELVHPQDMSVVEQVRLFSHSTHIFGEYGSGLHGSIFACPETNVTILRGTEGHPGFLQSGLCEALKQTHGYVFGSTETNGTYQTYEIDMEALKLCLNLLP